tara:strand:+ start:1284 stop:1490 length:207 start_codon:yes stop_codon:yes gene_type:complete
MANAKPNFETLAGIYKTNARTIRRWYKEHAVNVSDPLQVAIHLCSIQHPSESAFTISKKLLTKELTTI